jgi:hypothetical protein
MRKPDGDEASGGTGNETVPCQSDEDGECVESYGDSYG